MRVDLVEEMILNPDVLPAEFKGWRRFRVEYGGHGQDCLIEKHLYVPPKAKIADLLRFLNPDRAGEL